MPTPGAATAFRPSPEQFSRSRSGASWGTGEEKGGESRRRRERGKRGGEWRRIGAEGLAQRAKRKERELSAVEGGEADRVCRQPSGARALLKRRRAGRGERASFEERRRRGTRRRAPENLASAPSGDSERVASRPAFWPSGDSYASCRRRAGAPGEQAPKRRGADARGGFSPFLPLRGEKTSGFGEDEAWRASCGRSRRRLKASRRRAFQSPEGCPEGARPKARSVTGRGSGTDGAELGRREVADRRSGAKGARRGGGGAVSVRPAGGEAGGPV